MIVPLKDIKSAEVMSAEQVSEWYQTRQAKLNDPQTIITLTDKGVSTMKSTNRAIDADGVPALSQLKNMAENAGIPWNDDYADRAAAWWASDERVDRHGDIVEQTWKFDEYEQNPVMLFSHEWGLPPIGGVIDYQVRTRYEGGGYNGPSLHLVGLFATQEQWEWADTIYRLQKARFMRAGSVGFLPGTVINVKDKEERSKLGLGEWGMIFTDNMLIEWSPCSVPANPGATGIPTVIAPMKAAGLLRPGDLQVLREYKRRQLEPTRDNKRWLNEDAVLVTFWRLFFPEVKTPEPTELDAPLLLKELEILSKETPMHRKDGQPPPGQAPAGQQPNDQPKEVTMADVVNAVNILNQKLEEIKAAVTQILAKVGGGDANKPPPGQQPNNPSPPPAKELSEDDMENALAAVLRDA